MYVCPTCGRRVRPASDPGIVFALRKVTRAGNVAKVATTSGALDYCGWLFAFFHEPCLPNEPGEWRRRPMPDDVGDGEGES